MKLLKSMKKLINVRYDSILIVMNRLTKYAYFISYKEALNIDDLTYMMMRYIFVNHGISREMVSDRESK